jgi:hypothetical protein
MATAKEKVWLDEYFQCWNATEAARRAGYKWPNKYGPLKLKKLDAKIRRRLTENAMPADEVLSRLADHARSDVGPYIVAKDGVLCVDWDKLVEAKLTHLVKAIIPTRYGTRIEFHDAQAALVHLGRHHGLFTDKLAIKDWRKEAQQQGINPDAIISDLATEFTSAMGAGTSKERSLADSKGQSKS